MLVCCTVAGGQHVKKTTKSDENFLLWNLDSGGELENPVCASMDSAHRPGMDRVEQAETGTWVYLGVPCCQVETI